MLLLTTLSILATPPAHAGFPDDVTLSHLGTWRGDSVDNAGAQKSAYHTVVRQLAAGIANQPLSPARTLGLNGFDAQITQTWAFISADGEDVFTPDPWERVHQDEDPTRVMWLPGVQVRKGLPLSLEAGMRWSWIGFSRQTAVGGFGRWSVFEGWEKAPDVSFQLGYTGYIGNDELDLGVLDGTMSIGHTFAFGYLKGINQASVSPFVGCGMLKVNAMPRLEADAQQALGIGPVTGFKSKDHFKAGFNLVTPHLGVRIKSGDFSLATSGTITPKALPTISMAAGLSY
jgi:hypothetical protein